MNVSSYFIVTEPEKMGFPYIECMESALSFSDELVVVCGREEKQSEEKIRALGDKVKIIKTNAWPIDWGYDVMRDHLQIGLDACSGDFSLKVDVDWIFRAENSNDLRNIFEEHDDAHQIIFGKVNYYSGNWGCKRGFRSIKTPICYALNKTLLEENDITCEISNKTGSNLPSFDKSINTFDVNDNKLWPVNYDKTFMSKDQIIEQWSRWFQAYEKNRGSEYTIKETEDVWVHYVEYQKMKSSAVTFDEDSFHPEIMRKMLASNAV